MEDNPVTFAGNSQELINQNNNPLPTGAMVYNPKRPVANVPYTVGQRRAVEAHLATVPQPIATEPPVAPTTTVNKPEEQTKPEISIGLKRVAEAQAEKAQAEKALKPPAVEKAPAALSIGKQRTAKEKQTVNISEAPLVKAPTLVKPPTVGNKRVAEAQAMRAAKHLELVNNAGNTASINSNETNNTYSTASNETNNTTNTNSNITNENGMNYDERMMGDVEEAQYAEAQGAEAPFEETTDSKKVPYNRSLPHLLRIGDDSTSEYIELHKQFAKSAGAFNAHYVGSFNELQKLYGVSTAAQVEGMQYAFGVKRYGAIAPIHVYLEKGCRPPHTAEVMKAIKRRIQTLQESIMMKGTNGNTSLDKHKKQYLETLFLDMETKLKRECRPEELVNYKEPSPTKEATTKGCPCLDDLSLLRDLTYILALLQGNVHPEVKEQMDSIELGKILNTIRSNKGKSKSMLATAIKTLEGLAKQPAKHNSDQVQAILQTIYTHFEPSKPVPEHLTEDVVVTMLEDKIKIVQGAANHLAQMNTLQEELDAKTAEMVVLQDELQAAKNDGTGAQTQIAELQARLDRCAASLTATEAARNNARRNLAGLETSLTATQDSTRRNLAGLEAELVKAKADKEKAIVGLRSARLAAEEEASREHVARESNLEAQLVKAKGDKEKAIAGLRSAREAEAATMRASVEAAEAAVARAVAAVAAKEVELTAARAEAETARQEAEQTKAERDAALLEKVAAIKDKAQITEELKGITQRLSGLDLSAAQQAETLTAKQAAIDAANEQIADLQNQLAEALASKTTSNNEGKAANEALRKQVEELTAQLAMKEEEKQELQKQIDELLADTSQKLEGLRAELSALQASIRDKDTLMEEKERELEECRTSVGELEKAFVEANRKYTDAQQTIEANETQIQSLEEALRKCQADSTSALAAAELAKVTELADKNSKHAVELADKNRNHAVELTDKNSKHAAELAKKNANTNADLATLTAEQAAKNAAAATAKEALRKEIESLEEQLRLARAAAEEAKRNTEAALTKETGEKDSLAQQLAEANAQVAALENLLEQKNIGSKQALDEAIEAAKAAQGAAIQAMRNEKDAEKEAALTAASEECAKKIGEMNERLRLLEQEQEVASQKAATNLQAKQTELNTTRNAGVAASAAATEAAKEAAEEAEKQLAAKQNEINETKAALAAAQAKQEGLDSEIKKCAEQATLVAEQTKKLSEQGADLEAKKAELAQKQTALEAAEAASAASHKNAETAKSELDSMKKQADGKNVMMDGLKRNLQKATADLDAAKAATAKTTPEGAFQITQERLTNLLSYLIVDGDALQQAQDYLSMKKDKIPDVVTKQKDMMCNFFKYLYDVVKVQMNEFRSLSFFHESVKGKQTHLDIFQIFIASTIKDIPPGDMLRDLTNVFQYFFTISQNPDADLKQRSVLGMYMALQKLYNVLLTKDGGPLNSDIKSEKLTLLLNKFGPLSNISLQSSGNNGFYFVEKNVEDFRKQGTDPKLQAEPEGRFIPLIILAIKMVQLLSDEVKIAYTNMDGFCGYLKPVEGVVIRPATAAARPVTSVVARDIIISSRDYTASTAQKQLTDLKKRYDDLSDKTGPEAKEIAKKYVALYPIFVEKQTQLGIPPNRYTGLKDKYDTLQKLI